MRKESYEEVKGVGGFSRAEELFDEYGMALRGAEAEDILRDIAFKIINNMDLMQDIKIHCFPGGVTLTTTLTICGGKAFSETVAETSKRIMEDKKVQCAELVMSSSNTHL